MDAKKKKKREKINMKANKNVKTLRRRRRRSEQGRYREILGRKREHQIHTTILMDTTTSKGFVK